MEQQTDMIFSMQSEKFARQEYEFGSQNFQIPWSELDPEFRNDLPLFIASNGPYFTLCVRNTHSVYSFAIELSKGFDYNLRLPVHILFPGTGAELRIDDNLVVNDQWTCSNRILQKDTRYNLGRDGHCDLVLKHNVEGYRKVSRQIGWFKIEKDKMVSFHRDSSNGLILPVLPSGTRLYPNNYSLIRKIQGKDDLTSDRVVISVEQKSTEEAPGLDIVGCC